MNSKENLSTYMVCVSGLKGVGKRTFINAITENKRTSQNMPVLTFSNPKTGKDCTLCFYVTDITVKGVHIPKGSQTERGREFDIDKSIMAFSTSQLPNHERINIYMYDVTNRKSFEVLKEQIGKHFTKETGIAFLIGNK
jgi:GTPase SAR1 family protein